MLSQEENETLTQVGPGTPMGNLLRRYWHPVAAVAELEERPTRPVKLLDEDLVVFKTGADSYALIERYCAHRGTDLAHGIIEDASLRCPRHGWLYGETGLCLDMPLEEQMPAEEIRLNAYQAQAKGGMLWAYLGPEPVPLIPDWEPFSWQDGLVQVVLTVLHCNWLQCQENTLDGVDLELFVDAMERAAERGEPPPLPPLDFAFDEFEHGFVVRPGEGAEASVTKTSLWPNGLFSGNARSCRFEWRVPMDDETTLNIAWFFDRAAPGSEAASTAAVHYWYASTREEETGEALRTHLLNKKFAIWLNQAPIVDRTKEHLSEGDEGVVMLRNKLFSQIALIQDGGDPKALIYDPAQNQKLRLPETKSLFIEPSDDVAELSFPYLAGQPEDAAEAYRKVIESWRQQESSGDRLS